jgi:hypothetical protein
LGFFAGSLFYTTIDAVCARKYSEGLRVKAHAACWGLLSDIEESEQETLSVQMAVSIVRDLIRAFDPNPEHPSALKKLVGGSLPS